MAAVKKKQSKPSLPFNKRLVLNRYILSLFGVENFEDLSIYVNKMENEGWTEDRISKFHYAVVQALPLDSVVKLFYSINRCIVFAQQQGKRLSF